MQSFYRDLYATYRTVLSSDSNNKIIATQKLDGYYFYGLPATADGCTILEMCAGAFLSNGSVGVVVANVTLQEEFEDG